ncbi:hypothetical protein ANN_24618 [Periplaneta americana]|uniref:Uncharacterized protein n=1 Tax=Periplaneta americana TaxID=6978 RepID=A0ABQ8S3H6_PERAM|nr:hypothetical protein ANN_24618 [Periplaneta americana]
MKKRRIDKYRDTPPQNPDQFWDQGLATWEDFAKDQNYFRDLVDSMPQKCQAVIDADTMLVPNLLCSLFHTGLLSCITHFASVSLLLFCCMPCHLDATLWNYTHSDDDDERSCADAVDSATDSEGHNSHSILNRWKNYFWQLLNRPNRNNQNEIQIQTVEPFVPEPTLSEVEIAIENLKNYKSPGIDQIPAELIQEDESALSSEIYKLVLTIWEKEIVPEQWKESIVVPIFEKRDKTNCSNFRDNGHSSKETDADSGGSSSTTTLSLDHSHEVLKLLQDSTGGANSSNGETSGAKNHGAIPKLKQSTRMGVGALTSGNKDLTESSKGPLSKQQTVTGIAAASETDCRKQSRRLPRERGTWQHE